MRAFGVGNSRNEQARIRSVFPATAKALTTPRSVQVKLVTALHTQNRDSRLRLIHRATSMGSIMSHSYILRNFLFLDLFFPRGNAYANRLAPPVSMASISAWVQGRRPNREGSSARSKNSPFLGWTEPSEAPELPPMVLLKEERPSGPCC